MHASRVLVAALTAICGASLAHSQTSADWPTFGGAPGGAQHSPLDQINVDNVEELEVAWVHNSGDDAWLEVTPIHANDMLYY